MRILRFYVPNSLDNFNHLIVDAQDNTALVVDPFNAEQVIDLADRHALKLVGIVLTHSHKDHWQGAPELVERLQLPVYASHQHFGYQGEVHPLKEGDQLTILGEPIHIRETPGHMSDHLLLTLATDEGPAAICADTLFNAGVGNVRAGNVDELFASITRMQAELCENTLIYPAHDYLCHNLGFTLKFEPDNLAAQAFLNEQSQLAPDDRAVTSLAMEKQINLFMRLNRPIVKEKLAKLGYNVASNQAVFSALRAERDQW